MVQRCMPRILVVDDDPNLCDMVALALEDAGHDVVTAQNGAAGLRKAENADIDLVVSDVNMPGMDGFTLCRRIRDLGITAPIVLLTARDSEIDEALGLELGADDYVVKPFSTRVLLARIAALLRREQFRTGGPALPPAIEVGKLRLDPGQMLVTYDGQPIQTTLTEFRLLAGLSSHPGRAFGRQQLLDLSRGDDSVVVARLIDTYVRRLRRKFEQVDPTFDRIETLTGVGYRWRAADG